MVCQDRQGVSLLSNNGAIRDGTTRGGQRDSRQRGERNTPAYIQGNEIIFNTFQL